MLEVQVQFEDNLYTEMMLENQDVPCLCRISDKFYIDFLEAIPQVIGQVLNFDLADIDKRVPASAGGEFLHYKYSLITLLYKQKNIYIIENLTMFARGVGWIKVIEDGEYTDIVEVKEPDWLKNL